MMRGRLSRFVVPAVLAVAIPAAAVLAQSPNQPPDHDTGPSADALARLQGGRFAMIKEALKLNDAQLKLWAPVEAQMRASFTARQQARAGRREKGQQGDESLPLPDRLDRASERMAKRAEQVKAFADVIRPFYASLTDDQKAVANVVLGQGRSDRGFRGRHWTMNRGPGADQD